MTYFYFIIIHQAISLLKVTFRYLFFYQKYHKINEAVVFNGLINEIVIFCFRIFTFCSLEECISTLSKTTNNLLIHRLIGCLIAKKSTFPITFLDFPRIYLCYTLLKIFFWKTLFFINKEIGQQDLLIIQQKKINKKMFYWCFNCSKITIPHSGMKCQFCLSQAIEEMKEQNSPAQFIPYNLLPQPTQTPTHGDDSTQMISLTRIVRYPALSFFSITPNLSFVRIIRLVGEEEQGASVDDQKYQKLQKVNTLSSECAVCQQKQGKGVKLGCRHEFHDECLRPWFKNANTCPCCRATV